MPVRNRFVELHAEIAGWRREIHANPELMYDTHRTSAMVADLLRGFGCDEVVEGVGRTGVVGVVRGRSDTQGHVVGLRADMDGLPIKEATGLDYTSAVPGRMHACGHDGHTAMLLGAAKYLAETRRFDGAAVFVFQPAEEGGAGGKAMCEDGLMERWNIREIYAMHNMPGVPAGRLAVRAGPLLAATDEFEIRLVGRAGHAAKPDQTKDPVVFGCQLIVALQSIVSRNVDPVKQAVVSVTSCETDTSADNVIPQSMLLRGTVRTMDMGEQVLIRDRLREMVDSVANGMGGSAELLFRDGYPSLVNSGAETDYAAEAACAVVGDVADAPMSMGAEDFAYMLQERPGSFVIIGNGSTAGLHNPKYDFNDGIIPAGCSFFVELVERRMPVN